MIKIIIVLAGWLWLSGPAAHDLAPYWPAPQKQVVLADFAMTGQNHFLLPWTIRLPQSQKGIDVRPAGTDPEDHPAVQVSYTLPGTPSDNPDAGYGLQQTLPDLNAAGFDHLVFWIKGDSREGGNGELELRIERPDPALPGKQAVARYRISGMTAEWQRRVIPLNQIIGIDQWEHLNALAITIPLQRGQARKGGFSLGSLGLIQTGQPGPGRYDPLIPEQRSHWAASLGGESTVQTALRARLGGWPERFLTESAALPRDDQAFLSRVAADTWRGVAALVDWHHGLPIDRIQLKRNSLEPQQAAIGDYTNISTVGLYLLSVLSAHELGLIQRPEALERLSLTLGTLEELDTWQGFFYNYYNTTTLERTSHFISFVDSAWLTGSLMVIRQAFPEVAARCSHLIDSTDYRFFYDPETRLMSHGYHVNLGQRSNMHYGVMYAESRLGSLIAIGKGDVPAEHWFNLVRTFPADHGWQSQPPLDRTEQTAGGYRWMGGHYQWRDFRYVPSWGGSLFEALMPGLLLDETQFAPHGLGYNNRIHTTIHRMYALEELSYPVWGMSPSSTPGSTDHYDEYGIKFLGATGYPSGVVTPHVSALALMTEPTAAIANLRTLAERYPVYGDFGFYDAVSPGTGEVSYSYLSLDQAMTLIGLANYLKDHVIQTYFAREGWIKSVVPLLALERMDGG